MKNILLIAVAFWLLFLNGFSTLTNLIPKNASLNTAPQIITAGANRVMQTVQPSQQIVVRSMPILPTATPVSDLPALPTVVPVIASQPINAEFAPLPTRTPVPALETENDPRYPSDGINWQVHQIPLENGTWQDCVFVYEKMRKVCFNPGVHPTRDMIDRAVMDIYSGEIDGEPINSYG